MVVSVVAHLVRDDAVGGGSAVEPLEVVVAFAAGGLLLVPLRIDGQRRDERAAHGPERLHLRRAQPVRVPVALAPPQQRASPPPPRRRRRRWLILLRCHSSWHGLCGVRIRISLNILWRLASMYI